MIIQWWPIWRWGRDEYAAAVLKHFDRMLCAIVPSTDKHVPYLDDLIDPNWFEIRNELWMRQMWPLMHMKNCQSYMKHARWLTSAKTPMKKTTISLFLWKNRKFQLPLGAEKLRRIGSTIHILPAMKNFWLCILHVNWQFIRSAVGRTKADVHNTFFLSRPFSHFWSSCKCRPNIFLKKFPECISWVLILKSLFVRSIQTDTTN